MVGYRDTINNKKTRNRELIRKLKEELEKNDNRRGSDYTKVFQWVADYKV
jgi:hypothetical protein